MKKLYSIGEMAKLANVSIQTLRYYEKINLFKPVYIDPVTNYRYYAESQFHYLDIIRSLKFLGLPLEQIKEAQQLSPEQLLLFMEKQDEVIIARIKQLEEVRQSLHKSKQQLKEQLAIPWLNEVYEKELGEERILMIIPEHASPRYVPDIYFTTLFKTIEGENSMLNSRYGSMFPLAEYSKVDDIVYSEVYVSILTDRKLDKLLDNTRMQTIPASRYICIAYEINLETYLDTYMYYYNKLYSYIVSHNLNVESIVYEISMPNNYAPEQEVQFILELKIAYITA